MSKSRGNVVNPDKIVCEFGADALRLYEMFMGPLEATKPWSTSGVGGVRGFLDRCWRLVVDEGAEDIQLAPQVTEKKPTDEQMRAMHRMLDKVTSDIDSLSFNTAIAKMMEFVNFATPLQERPREMLSLFVSVLSPFAPHLAEELWTVLGNTSPVSLASLASCRDMLAPGCHLRNPSTGSGKTSCTYHCACRYRCRWIRGCRSSRAKNRSLARWKNDSESGCCTRSDGELRYQKLT